MRLFQKKASPDVAGKVDENEFPVRNVIVFDGSSMNDWPGLFEQLGPLPGSRIRVLQTSWMDCEVTVDSSNTLVSMKPVRDTFGIGVDRKEIVTVQSVDYILQRNQCRGPTPGSDRRHVLYGLIMANVPAMNSLLSEYIQLERSCMLGALRSIQARLGQEAFPLNDITFYSSPSAMIISPDLPAIIKISHAHAGQGKIKVDDQQAFNDMRSVLMLHEDYATAEPFFPYDSGIRVQKVCDTYRVWEKIPTGSSWKSQFGGSNLVEIPLTPMFKLWADECSAQFGGLDICAVDALKKVVNGEPTYIIIELNGTACGFQRNSWAEDSTTLAKELHRRLGEVLKRTNSKGGQLKDVSKLKM